MKVVAAVTASRLRVRPEAVEITRLVCDKRGRMWTLPGPMRWVGAVIAAVCRGTRGNMEVIFAPDPPVGRDGQRIPPDEPADLDADLATQLLARDCDRHFRCTVGAGREVRKNRRER